jgi:hypothetical protein
MKKEIKITKNKTLQGKIFPVMVSPFSVTLKQGGFDFFNKSEKVFSLLIIEEAEVNDSNIDSIFYFQAKLCICDFGENLLQEYDANYINGESAKKCICFIAPENDNLVCYIDTRVGQILDNKFSNKYILQSDNDFTLIKQFNGWADFKLNNIFFIDNSRTDCDEYNVAICIKDLNMKVDFCYSFGQFKCSDTDVYGDSYICTANFFDYWDIKDQLMHFDFSVKKLRESWGW